MSFTIEIINELTRREREKTCCKKAFLFGLFFGAEKISKNEVKAELKTEQSASIASSILQKQFSAEPKIESIVRAGRRLYVVTVVSKAIALYIEKIDKGEDIGLGGITQIVGFRCEDCKRAFLAGVFVSSGISTDPQKRYSVEFCTKSQVRAEWLKALLTVLFAPPSRIERQSRIGLYYKGNERITDILVYIGAYDASFKVIDAFAAHGIRNIENRITNCSVGNISRTVSATRKHVEAIILLKESGRFELLSEDLKYTAELRLEYDYVSLSELAALHEPSISKSGLNRRLERILAISREVE